MCPNTWFARVSRAQDTFLATIFLKSQDWLRRHVTRDYLGYLRYLRNLPGLRLGDLEHLEPLARPGGAGQTVQVFSRSPEVA